MEFEIDDGMKLPSVDADQPGLRSHRTHEMQMLALTSPVVQNNRGRRRRQAIENSTRFQTNEVPAIGVRGVITVNPCIWIANHGLRTVDSGDIFWRQIRHVVHPS